MMTPAIMSKNIATWLLQEIFNKLPDNKRNALKRCLDRNCYLTSAYLMEIADVEVYKEGWFLIFYGTRCKFSVFAKDNDGEIEILDRKPHKSKLNLLYKDYWHLDEGDFYNV